MFMRCAWLFSWPSKWRRYDAHSKVPFIDSHLNFMIVTQDMSFFMLRSLTLDTRPDHYLSIGWRESLVVHMYSGSNLHHVSIFLTVRSKGWFIEQGENFRVIGPI